MCDGIRLREVRYGMVWYGEQIDGDMEGHR